MTDLQQGGERLCFLFLVSASSVPVKQFFILIREPSHAASQPLGESIMRWVSSIQHLSGSR